MCVYVCNWRGGGSGSRAGNMSLGFPGRLSLKKSQRVGASLSLPRLFPGRGWGMVWLQHLTGPPHPKTEANSHQRPLIGQSRPLEPAHRPGIKPATPGPMRSTRSRGSRRQPPPPPGAREGHAGGERGKGAREGGRGHFRSQELTS